jgi:hypothetical protein
LPVDRRDVKSLTLQHNTEWDESLDFFRDVFNIKHPDRFDISWKFKDGFVEMIFLLKKLPGEVLYISFLTTAFSTTQWLNIVEHNITNMYIQALEKAYESHND